MCAYHGEPRIDEARRKELEKIPLTLGSHESADQGFCVMELAAYLAREPWSDSPKCVSPVIADFLRTWNDILDDEKRQLLRPYALRVIDTAGTREVEEARAWLAVDWLVRTNLLAWLDLAKLTKEADAIRALPQITSATIVASAPTITAVQEQAAAAWNAAWDAAWTTARDAAWEAARDAAAASSAVARDTARAAARAAAWNAARDAARAAAWEARDAAWAAARDAAREAAREAAWNAARTAARTAAWDVARTAAGDDDWETTRDAARNAAGNAAWEAAREALRPTVEILERSAFELLDRMIDA